MSDSGARHISHSLWGFLLGIPNGVSGAVGPLWGANVPALIIAKLPDTAVLVVGAVMVIVATIGVTVVLNFVSPAYDLANVWPK